MSSPARQPATGISNRNARDDWWRLHNQPAFWLVAAAVFLGNAIVSAAAGERVMVALQTVTGLLALLAAATAAAKPNN